MAELPGTARVVVIGGGAVGVSALYHLARAGWSDCLLLERNELTSGSTWHAAGNVPTFSTSWALMNMQRYSTELYRGLGAEVDYPLSYHVTGSLRLGHGAERMREFRRAAGMGRRQGMAIEIVGPEEMRRLYPFLETHDLAGALHDPNDGDIDPAQLTQALARGARRMGARIERFCPVTAARRERGEWVLKTPKGTVRAEFVVNAAGYRAAEVGALLGRKVPVTVMAHQYLLFEEIPELVTWSREAGHKLPLLRDVDTSWYLRQEKGGMNLGPYERACRAHWTTPEDPLPEDFSFQLFPDDLERLQPYLEDAAARVPILATAGLSRVINGPIPYTPDGNPLIGPMPGVPNAFEACVFSFGIAQAGGAGKVLAEWVTEGATEWDMWACDPRRFTEFAAAPDYTLARAREIYGHEYAIHFPHQTWPAGRGRKLSPLHERLAGLGAQFGPWNGWERANWYAQPGDDTSESGMQTFLRAGPWAPRVREECLAVRDAAGILDLPGFSRFELAGPGARDWLARQITGRVPRPGRMGLGYFADRHGRLVTEMSLMAHEDGRFWLITAAAAEGHDFEWLARHLPKDGSLRLENITARFACQILTGPATRTILAACCDGDLSAPWLSHQGARIAGRPLHLVRVSYAGELGWELHSAPEDTPTIFEAVMAAGAGHGLRPFGMFALDSLRLEKGYRVWKQDLSTDYTVLESGLERFIDWDKAGFHGKEALAAERAAEVRKRLSTLVLDEAGPCDAPYMANVLHEGKIAGEVLSGGYGHRVGRAIALAMLPAALAAPGTRVEIDIYGDITPATVQPDAPLWDPENRRLRA